MKKRIVHLISSLKMGGAESLLSDFVTHPNNQHYEHIVVYFHAGPHVQRLQNHVPLYQLKGLFCLYDPVFFIRLFKLIKKLKPDCIHAWLWSANFAGRIIGRLLKIPTINAIHNNVDQNGFIRNKLDSFTHQFADTIVVVSKGTQQSLQQTQRSLTPGSIKVITNGIDSGSLVDRGVRCNYTRSTLGLSEHHFVIGSVGRFVALKNYPLLIDAFAIAHKRHQHARLVLIGTGPDEEKLRCKVREKGLEQAVIFIINQPSCGYYPLFDCFVQSSFKEGISIALLEAMCFGLACIVTQSTKHHDVITNRLNGFVIASGDKDKLAAAINALIADKSLGETIGNEAQRTINKQFEFNAMIKAYQNLYSEIINH